MGWSTWNFWNCRVNETVLRDAADAFVSLGLRTAGYRWIDADDCWLLDHRTPSGDLIPDPAKFPNGLAATVAYIRARGLEAGLYIARGNHTCCGLMGACGHEAQDAAWFVAQGISYVKDDSCGACHGDTYLESYGKMQDGLFATGVPAMLSVEGRPPLANMSAGGYGQTLRVGHDISADFMSAFGLVDIDSGLWPWAHNASSSPTGADLDIMEIGNGEFAPRSFAADDPQGRGVTIARAMMSLWCLLKAPLILGNDLEQLDPLSLAIVTNADALSANQDALGVQGRRVAVAPPRNATIGTWSWDANAVLRVCDAGVPTQSWRLEGANATSALTGSLVTVDAEGVSWCLQHGGSNEGSYGAVRAPCDGVRGTLTQFRPKPASSSGPGGDSTTANYTLWGLATRFEVDFNNQVGASGPVAHSRYLQGGGDASRLWAMDAAALLGSGSAVEVVGEPGILDDDLVGGVVVGGRFCLDVVQAGMLEVWTAPLTGGRFASVLFNRSPALDAITLRWEDLAVWRAVAPTNQFSVRDVWAATDRGVFSGAYTDAAVVAHGVAMLILTPVTAAAGAGAVEQ